MARQYGFYDKELKQVIWYDADDVDQRCRELRDAIEAPMIISDTMDAIKYNGLHYESKRAYEQAIRRDGHHIAMEADIAGRPFDVANYDFNRDGTTKPINREEIIEDTAQAQYKAVQALKHNEIQLSPQQKEAAKAINEAYKSQTGKSATIIKDRSTCKTRVKKKS